MAISRNLLHAAAADAASPAWGLIWHESFDQGSAKPGSAALLAWLAPTCAAFLPTQREEAVTHAGVIAVDASDAERAAYQQEIQTLRALTTECLPSASTDRMFVCLQQALLAYDGAEWWGKELDRINDEEADVVCPGCDEDLLVDVTSGNPLLTPGLSSPLATRLHAEAVQAGRDAVADALRYFFGRLTCANCATTFDLADHLAGM